MTDRTCERCRQPGAQNFPALDLMLCPGCADEYQRIDAAGTQLRILLQPIIKLWATYWRERGITPPDLQSAVQLIAEEPEMEI